MLGTHKKIHRVSEARRQMDKTKNVNIFWNIYMDIYYITSDIFGDFWIYGLDRLFTIWHDSITEREKGRS